MTTQADGRYDNTKPWNAPPAWSYLRPWDAPQARLIAQALAANTTPGNELADIVRPPLDQIQLFRPRFGYRDRQLTLNDIINVDEMYQEPPQEFNGGPGAGYQGSSRNTDGNGVW